MLEGCTKKPNTITEEDGKGKRRRR